jgi:hypothetical protein
MSPCLEHLAFDYPENWKPGQQYNPTPEEITDKAPDPGRIIHL